jgi:hypothetical protein
MLKIVNAVRQCCCVEAECHFCYLRDFACGILSEYFTRLHSHPTLPRHDVGSIVDLGQSTHPQSHPASLALFRGSSITHAPVGPSIHLTNPSTNHDVQTIADRVPHPVPAICRSRKTAPTLRSIRVQFRPAGRSLARQQSPLEEARYIGSSMSAFPFRRLPQSFNRSLQPAARWSTRTSTNTPGTIAGGVSMAYTRGTWTRSASSSADGLLGMSSTLHGLSRRFSYPETLGQWSQLLGRGLEPMSWAR